MKEKIRRNTWVAVITLFTFILISGCSSRRGTPITTNYPPTVISETATTSSISNTLPAFTMKLKKEELSKNEEGGYYISGKADVPFTGLSVGWLSDNNNLSPQNFEVQIRTKREDGNWCEWVSGTGEISPSDSPSGLFWSELYIPCEDVPHKEFEVKVIPPQDTTLTYLTVSGADASYGLQVKGKLFDERKYSGVGSCPPIITRDEWWGSLPADKKTYSDVSYTNVSHVIIHHTAGANNPSNPAQTVRNIWYDHVVNRGWKDIGYNYLLDQHGNIYQGRHNPDLCNKDVVGAHATDFNTNTMGVSFLGTFTNVMPTTNAITSCEQLLGWKFNQRGLDPREQATINSRTLPRIFGHREVANKDCPGTTLNNYLPTMRNNVYALIPPFDYTISLSPAQGSVAKPNSLSTTLTVTRTAGIPQQVSFSTSNVPAGVTTNTLSPGTPSSSFTRTLTFTTSCPASAGTSTIRVNATAGSVSKSANYQLTVQDPFDFTVSASGQNALLLRGGSISSTVTVTLTGGTCTRDVSLSVSGLPSGVTATGLSSGSPTFSRTLTLSASSTATTGNHTITITASGGGITRTTTLSFTVAQMNFTISVSPTSGTVRRGNSISTTVTVTRTAGTSTSVSFSISGLPSGVTTNTLSSGTPNNTITRTLTFTASSTATTGTRTITISASGGGLTRSTTYNLTVTQ